MGDLSGALLVVPVVTAVAGFLLARFLFGLGERARHEALEAQCREEVKAAGVARDRHQALVTVLETRLATLREDHAGCDDRIQNLEDDLKAYTQRDLLGELRAAKATLEQRETALAGLEAQRAAQEKKIAALQKGAAAAEKQAQVLDQTRAELADTKKRSIELDQHGTKLERQVAELTQKEEELGRLRDDHAVAQARIRDLEALVEDYEQVRDGLERTTVESAERGERVTALERDLAAAHASSSSARETLAGLERRVADLAKLEPALAERDRRIATMTKEHRQAIASLTKDRDTKVATLSAARDEALARRKQLDGEVGRLERALEKVSKNNAALDEQVASQAERIDTLDEELAERDEALAVGEPATLLEEADGEPDTLTALPGIGAVFERRLNDLGIFHYHQIARLSVTETAWLALRLNVSPDRIKREKWITQAKKRALRKS